MKRFFKSLLVIMLILSTLLGTTSCAMPERDLEDADENLADEGYFVYYSDDDDEPGIKESLYAYDDDDNFLFVYVCETRKMAKLLYRQFELERQYDIESTELAIKLIEHQLKKFDDDMNHDEVDELEDELKDLKKELKALKKKVVIGKSGKTVWYGTKDAIEDSKG